MDRKTQRIMERSHEGRVVFASIRRRKELEARGAKPKTADQMRESAVRLYAKHGGRS